MTNQNPEAQAEAKTKAGEPDGQVDTHIRIELDFDMATNRLTMKSKAPTVMIQGVLHEAQSQITQNQVMQRLQSAAAKASIVKPSAGFPN